MPEADGFPSARAGGNKPFQRAMNRALVLQALRSKPGTSRRDLADELGLDRSTISNITGELIDAGLIGETADVATGRATGPTAPGEDGGAGVSRSGRGRPPVGLRVLDERLCALGLEITGRGYRALVVDNAGAVRYREESGRAAAADHPTTAGRGEFAERLSRFVADIISRAEREGERGGEPFRVVGAGCAIPGSVDSSKALLIRSRELSLSDERLPVQSAGEYPVPIVCDNDAHCGAWGEIHARTRAGAGVRGRAAQGAPTTQGAEPYHATHPRQGPAGAGKGGREARPAAHVEETSRALEADQAGRPAASHGLEGGHVPDGGNKRGAADEGRGANLLFVLGRSSRRHLGVGIGLVVDGLVRYGGSYTAGEFYSGRWTGDEASQFSLPPDELARAAGDSSLRARVFAELCEGLVPVASVTDPQAVVFGGLFREHFGEIAEAAGHFDAGKRVSGLFSVSRLEADEIAGGAAALFHEQLFRVPRYDRSAGAPAVHWDRVIELLRATA